MLGYVDSIVERQDKYDILKKVESFEVEVAARKAMRELVEHFQKVNNDMKNVQKDQSADIRRLKEHSSAMKSMITKLQNTAAEIPGLQKKIQKEKTCRETNEANAIRNMDSIKEKIENSAKYLEGRLDIVDTLEDRIRM